MRDPYDRERCIALQTLTARISTAHASSPVERIEALFEYEHGYATPEVNIRAAVLDADMRLPMVREVADGDRWTLPGGWADVNLTPEENAVKEVHEKSDYRETEGG